MTEGQRVRLLRELAHLSLDEAGEMLGVNAAHLSRLERGYRTLSPEFLSRAEQVLGPLARRRAAVLEEVVAV